MQVLSECFWIWSNCFIKQVDFRPGVPNTSHPLLPFSFLPTIWGHFRGREIGRNEAITLQPRLRSRVLIHFSHSRNFLAVFFQRFEHIPQPDFLFTPESSLPVPVHWAAFYSQTFLFLSYVSFELGVCFASIEREEEGEAKSRFIHFSPFLFCL